MKAGHCSCGVSGACGWALKARASVFCVFVYKCVSWFCVCAQAFVHMNAVCFCLCAWVCAYTCMYCMCECVCKWHSWCLGMVCVSVCECVDTREVKSVKEFIVCSPPVIILVPINLLASLEPVAIWKHCSVYKLGMDQYSGALTSHTNLETIRARQAGWLLQKGPVRSQCRLGRRECLVRAHPPHS